MRLVLFTCVSERHQMQMEASDTDEESPEYKRCRPKDTKG